MSKRGLLNNRLNSFQESELSFEDSGVGSNGLRSSRIRKSKKQMNAKKGTTNTDAKKTQENVADTTKVLEDFETQNSQPCLSIGKFGTCGPGAAYRKPRPRRNCCREMRQTDMSGTGIEFDAQVSCFNPYNAPRKCCPPSLDLNLPYYNSFSG